MRAGLQTEAREEAAETVRSCPAYSQFVPAVLEDMEEREVTSRRTALRPDKDQDGGWKHAGQAGAKQPPGWKRIITLQPAGKSVQSMAEVGNRKNMFAF